MVQAMQDAEKWIMEDGLLQIKGGILTRTIRTQTMTEVSLYSLRVHTAHVIDMSNKIWQKVVLERRSRYKQSLMERATIWR